MSSIRIHAIQTGTVAIKQRQRDGEGHDRRNLARVLADKQWTEPLPILTWAIEHPEGLIVFDTGETSRVADPGYLPRWHPYFRLGLREWVAPEAEIGPQLRTRGLNPDDVRWVVLSHFHTDHAGGLAHFPNSEIIASKADYDHSRGIKGKVRGFLPQHWPDWFAPTLIESGDGSFGPFTATTALTRAGDVHLIPTPGHTPGHMSLAIEDGETVIFLAADASYTEQLMLDGIADGVSPDPAQARATLGRIRTLVQERPTVYLPTHDPQSEHRLSEALLAGTR